MSSYEFLAILEGKIGKDPFFRVQSEELTVCQGNDYFGQGIFFKMHFLSNESNLPTYVKNGLIKYQISKNEGGGWRVEDKQNN